jgi:hypothetical protein
MLDAENSPPGNAEFSKDLREIAFPSADDAEAVGRQSTDCVRAAGQQVEMAIGAAIKPSTADRDKFFRGAPRTLPEVFVFLPAVWRISPAHHRSRTGSRMKERLPGGSN